jgi:hypothetical protein
MYEMPARKGWLLRPVLRLYYGRNPHVACTRAWKTWLAWSAWPAVRCNVAHRIRRLTPVEVRLNSLAHSFSLAARWPMQPHKPAFPTLATLRCSRPGVDYSDITKQFGMSAWRLATLVVLHALRIASTVTFAHHMRIGSVQRDTAVAYHEGVQTCASSRWDPARAILRGNPLVHVKTTLGARVPYELFIHSHLYIFPIFRVDHLIQSPTSRMSFLPRNGAPIA